MQAVAFTVICFVLAFTRCDAITVFECKGSQVAHTIRVSQNKKNANFSRIQDAINSIPSRNQQWIRVLVSPGTYTEKVAIPYDKQCIVLQGNTPLDTVVAFNDHDPNFLGHSATFTNNASNFVAINMGFKNTYGSTANGNWSRNEAVKVYGDRMTFYNCRFEAIQDTLWDSYGRHYFKNCYIKGAVDFIWGNAQSVYEDCTISTLFNGYITAQGRQTADDPSGFVFIRGKVGGPGKSYLGRGYAKFSRVVFTQTRLGNVVQPAGWLAWYAAHHEQDTTYIESQCSGPGSDLRNRVPWMKKRVSEQELAQYTVSAFIDQDGWIAKQPHVTTLST